MRASEYSVSRQILELCTRTEILRTVLSTLLNTNFLDRDRSIVFFESTLSIYLWHGVFIQAEQWGAMEERICHRGEGTFESSSGYSRRDRTDLRVVGHRYRSISWNVDTGPCDRPTYPIVETTDWRVRLHR